MATKSNNSNLSQAKKAKNDEFYTQYADIQKEINAYLEYDPDVFRNKTVFCPCDDPEWSNFTIFFAQNFDNFGLKKLICTSFAPDSNQYNTNYQPTLFETESPHFDKDKTHINGKLFILDTDNNKDGKINFNDLEWEYLKGDGDFRSNEVKPFRDEADFIITNPPFSLFREFLAWILEPSAQMVNDDNSQLTTHNSQLKKFAIIGNMNAITYKEVFPLIKENKIWLGVSTGAKEYIKPDKTIQKMGNTCWYTNIEHGRRHLPMKFMNMKDNLRFNKKIKNSDTVYKKYDNYDAIEVPFVIAIPSDYAGVMGVPISFLEKYCPEQFEILGCDFEVKDGKLNEIINKEWKGKLDRGYINNERIYARILIKHKN